MDLFIKMLNKTKIYTSFYMTCYNCTNKNILYP